MYCMVCLSVVAQCMVLCTAINVIKGLPWWWVGWGEANWHVISVSEHVPKLWEDISNTKRDEHPYWDLPWQGWLQSIGGILVQHSCWNSPYLNEIPMPTVPNTEHDNLWHSKQSPMQHHTKTHSMLASAAHMRIVPMLNAGAPPPPQLSIPSEIPRAAP